MTHTLLHLSHAPTKTRLLEIFALSEKRLKNPSALLTLFFDDHAVRMAQAPYATEWEAWHQKHPSVPLLLCQKACEAHHIHTLPDGFARAGLMQYWQAFLQADEVIHL